MKISKKTLIIGGLVLVVVAILVGFATVPNVIAGASPVLLVLVLCPLMMLLMMGGMMGGMNMNKGMDNNNQPHSGHNPYGILPSQSRLTREKQLAELKFQSSELQRQQEALPHQIDPVEASRAVREAEAVARSADDRLRG